MVQISLAPCLLETQDDLNSAEEQLPEASQSVRGNAESTRPALGSMGRTMSTSSTKIPDGSVPSRTGGTLRKRGSLRKRDSLRRSNSKRSVTAGSIKGTREDDDEYNSVYHTPVPTSGNPTDILANRFQGKLRAAIFMLCFVL